MSAVKGVAPWSEGGAEACVLCGEEGCIWGSGEDEASFLISNEGFGATGTDARSLSADSLRIDGSEEGDTLLPTK